MELSEQEKLLRLLAEALGSVKKETSDLTNMNSRLKSAEEAVAKAILNSNVGLIEAKKQYKEANDAKIKYNKAIKEAIGEMEKELSATDKIKKAQENLAKAYKSNTSEIAKYKSEIQSLRKEQEKEDEILKKVIRDTQTSKEKLLEFSKSVGGLTGSFKSSIAPIAGFIANLGAGTMSFNNIVTAGLRYNQLMFNVSRAQMVAGQSSKDLSSSIDGIAKTTNLSTVQFLEFAETIQKGFIGIRPTLQDTAKLSNQLASQIGPSFEAQKNASQNLISIQSKFPSLYSKIREGMDLVEKINSGNGGEADKQRLSALQSQVLMIQQLSGASNEEKMMSLQLTTEVTDAQKELNRTQAEAQKLSKAMGEAQKEMWKSLQPAILKATELVTKFINFASDNKEVVIAIGGIALALGGITVAATIARDAMLLFGAASGPIGWISLAVAAIGTGILKWQANTRKAKEEAEKQQQVMKAEANIQNQINNLSTKQQEEFKKLYTDKKLDQKNGEERRAIELEILSGFQKQTSEAKNLTLQMDAVTQDTEQQLGLIDKMTAGYQATANAASQFGMVNNNALQGLVKSAQLGIDAADNAVKKRMQSIQQVYQKQGISIPISMELDTKGQSENMVEILSKLAKQTTDLDKQKEIYSAITSLQNESVQLTNRTADMSKKKLDADMAGVKQMEEQTSAYEARLNTERQLMESAQFGMGASVSMMQKQVDLAYENIKTLKETETRMQNRLVLEGKVSKEQLLQIQNAKTAGQAQKIIEGIAGNNVQLQYDLNAYATQHQNLTKKEMDQQLKIYELTKDIREGYLDAIREMSTGAGEFEKIVGTQEMGVTQLMGAVDQFSKGALNTMKTGGQQSQETTAAGVGVDVTGRYQAGGGPMLSFNGTKEQEARNQRIYGYDKSKAEYDKIRSGEKSSSEVGAALGAGEDLKYLRPEQDEKRLIKEGTYEAIIKAQGLNVATTQNTDVMRLVNPGVTSGNFGRYERNNTNIDWATNKLNGIQSSAPASPSGFVRQSSSGEPLPGFTRRMGTLEDMEKEINKERKMIGVYKEAHSARVQYLTTTNKITVAELNKLTLLKNQVETEKELNKINGLTASGKAEILSHIKNARSEIQQVANLEKNVGKIENTYSEMAGGKNYGSASKYGIQTHVSGLSEDEDNASKVKRNKRFITASSQETRAMNAEAQGTSNISPDVSENGGAFADVDVKNGIRVGGGAAVAIFGTQFANNTRKGFTVARNADNFLKAKQAYDARKIAAFSKGGLNAMNAVTSTLEGVGGAASGIASTSEGMLKGVGGAASGIASAGTNVLLGKYVFDLGAMAYDKDIRKEKEEGIGKDLENKNEGWLKKWGRGMLNLPAVLTGLASSKVKKQDQIGESQETDRQYMLKALEAGKKELGEEKLNKIKLQTYKSKKYLEASGGEDNEHGSGNRVMGRAIFDSIREETARKENEQKENEAKAKESDKIYEDIMKSAPQEDGKVSKTKEKILGKMDTGSIANLSTNMRQSLGEFKKGKKESDASYQSRIEKTLMQKTMEGEGAKAWGEMTPEATKQFKEAAAEAAKKDYKKDGISESARRGMVNEAIKRAPKTEAEKRGFVASEEDQARFNSAKQASQRQFSSGGIGEEGTGGMGGGGAATILVQLSDDLTAVIKDVQGIMVQLQSVSSVKSTN